MNHRHRGTRANRQSRNRQRAMLVGALTAATLCAQPTPTKAIHEGIAVEFDSASSVANSWASVT